MLTTTFIVFANLFITVFNILLFARVIGSYFVNPENPLMGWLIGVTEPVLAPVRRMLPNMGGMDLAPLVTFFLLQGVGILISHLFS